MAYQLEGRLLEVCSCDVLCPCWIGEDPDHNGTCQAIVGWHIDRGAINGVDVSDLTLAALVHIPGNILKGNWRAAIVMDDRATPSQQDAILAVWTGQKGGPVADLAQLSGEGVSVERLPVVFTVDGGRGRIQVGQMAEADMAPYIEPGGQPTTLVESVFSTIPGSPAYVSKATHYRSVVPALGINLDLSNHNAVQGTFHFVA